MLRTAAAQANESPEDAYDEQKAANDLRAQDEHHSLLKALRERAEAMLMSNVIEGAEKRPFGSSMSPIAQDATAALVLCAHEAIEKSFDDATDRIAASAGQLDKLEALGLLLCDALGRGLPTARDERGYFEARALGKAAQTKAGRVAKALAVAEKQAADRLRNALKPKPKPEKEAARVAELPEKMNELAAQAAAAAAAIRAERYVVDFEGQAERAQVELGLAAPSTLKQLEKAALAAERKHEVAQNIYLKAKRKAERMPKPVNHTKTKLTRGLEWAQVEDEMLQQEQDMLQFKYDIEVYMQAQREVKTLMVLMHEAHMEAIDARTEAQVEKIRQEEAAKRCDAEEAGAGADESEEDEGQDENDDCPANQLLDKVMTKLKVSRDADHVWGPGWQTRPDKGYFDLRG